MRSTFVKADYHSSISAQVSPERAFRAIGRVSDWWALNVTGKSEKLRDNFRVNFGKTYVDFSITELIPDKKVVWLVTDCNLDWIKDKKEWKGTRMIFEITSEGNTTRVDVTHEGLVPDVECYNDCVKGWDFYIKDSLYHYLSEGNGKPESTGKNGN